MSMDRLAGSPIGHLVSTREGVRAYLPNPLPRNLSLSSSVVYQLDVASRAVATLAGVGETIPNPSLLIRPFSRREAVLSSRIEGTQASLSDLFAYEASGVRHLDVVEVANYIAALELGLELLNELPISLRLINQLHGRLMQGVRGETKRPGDLRTEQVWIGGVGTEIGVARFVPPPANSVRDLLLDWEKFANEQVEQPPLVRCALLHYQFETIHPYRDGNGRVGRLLITLFLCAKKVLPTRLLYLSAYFERDRGRYYDELFNVSASGDWERWLSYFLQGVSEQAEDALNRVRHIRALQDRYRRVLQDHRESANAIRVVEELFASPMVTIPKVARTLGISAPGARRIVERLVNIGIITELEGRHPRLFVARELLDILQAAKAEAY